LNIIDSFLKGFDVDAADKAHTDKDKKLVLRGGSVGCVIGQGECIGNPQEALARFIGYELPKDGIAPFYFAAGFGNEDVWENNLRKAGHKILTDAEEKIDTKIGNFRFTGSPDIRILDDDGKPKLGIELKAVCSPSTATDIYVFNKPKIKHVAQSAIYSHFLNIPYTLVYTSYSNYYPHMSVARKEKIWKIEPFVKEFPIKIDKDGWVLVKIGRSFEKTIVSVPGILKYYESIGTMYETRRADILQPRELDIFGEPQNFGGKGELAYDSFYKKVGVPSKWSDYVTALREHCKYIGGEPVI
jgi:hypothetical protein